MTNRERTRTLFVHSAASRCSALEGTPAYLFHRQRDSWWAHLDLNQGPTDYECFPGLESKRLRPTNRKKT